MTADFIKAFNHLMLYEVGPNFNSADPETIAGLIQTPAQRKKVGYTDIAGDRGGVTKFGIAQNSHPSISVPSLTIAQAMAIYETDYWNAGKCSSMAAPLSMVHFDACANHGLGGAAKLIQRALNITADGAIGPGTLKAIAAANPITLANASLDQRATFFQKIVANDPVQAKFLVGWLRRVTDLREWIKK